jgi:putative protein-disulfide isomerase
MIEHPAMMDTDFLSHKDNVLVTYYTDPLCCWSWAMEPAWKRLIAEYGGILHVRYKMGGIMRSWQRSKGARRIDRPSQMGPEWMLAANVSGSKINSKIWLIDPPTSSHPACIAVKCVELQSVFLGQLYLHLLRAAVMVQGRNIAMQATLLDLAGALELLIPEFDIIEFETDLLWGRGLIGFRDDLKDARKYNIQQFPTFIIQRNNGPVTTLRGYHTFEALRAADWASLYNAPFPFIIRSHYGIASPFLPKLVNNYACKKIAYINARLTIE